MSRSQIQTLSLADIDIETLRPYLHQMSAVNLNKLIHCSHTLSRSDIAAEATKVVNIYQDAENN